MKLLLAIVSNDDSSSVQSGLTNEGFFVTKLSTTGGFLKAGNTTFLIGTDDSEIERIIKIIGKYSQKRKTVLPSSMPSTTYAGAPINGGPSLVEVTVGGATVFVMNVERFEKM